MMEKFCAIIHSAQNLECDRRKRKLRELSEGKSGHDVPKGGQKKAVRKRLISCYRCSRLIRILRRREWLMR